MSSFVASSACRGQRPSGLVARHQYERPHLIARLLKDRRVARFVVAPDGFGKTSLVFEYADLVFEFRHVFWLKCGSPCFIRDIDQGSLAEDILRSDRSVALVVFEDVPRFEGERSRMFALAVDTLLEAGSEVIVTCRPACDVYAGLQRDRLLLTGFELLLQDSELRTRLPGSLTKGEGSCEVLRSERIACLKWKGGGELELAASIGVEELPGDVSLVIFAILVLGRGNLASLSAFVSEKRLPEVLRLLASGYPYLGIDLGQGVFEAVQLSAEALASGCLPLAEKAVRSCHYESRGMLVDRLADMLVARGSFDRAVDIVAALSPRTHAVAWLASRGWDLVFGGAAGQVYRLYDHLNRDRAHEKLALCGMASWAAYILEDSDRAFSLAKRVLAGRLPDEFDRTMACALLVQSKDVELRKRVLDTLALLLATSAQDGKPSSGTAEFFGRSRNELWPAFARLVLACERSVKVGLDEWVYLWEGSRRANARGGSVSGGGACRDGALMLGAVRLVDGLLEGCCGSARGTEQSSGLPGDVKGAMPLIASFMRDALEGFRAAGLPIGWLELEMLRSLDELSRVAPGLLEGELPRREEQPYRAAYASLLSQRASYARMRAEKERRSKDYYETHPDPFRKELRLVLTDGSSLRSAPPMLRVNLLGGFEVKVGDVEVGGKLKNHRKAKILLALLVVGRGRSVSRDYLAGLLWPESSPAAARKNFYGVWMKLSRALEVEGSCPYLVRDKGGCHLDTRLLSCDVEEYEDLCRFLLVGEADEWDWENLFLRISDLSSRDLMPGEEGNEHLCRMRERFRLKLTDSLIFASDRLLQIGELQGSMWFAREAWHRDHMREDACMALMRAQAALGQRGSAIESFFVLKQSLADELGLDPSPRMIDLYGSILTPELASA